jgi:hypothetical protein
MDFKQLYIFVEGTDDERFIEKAIKPHLLKRYAYVKTISYAQLPKNNIEKFIQTYKKQGSSDYIFLCDLDARGDKTLCVSSKKQSIQNKYGNFLELEKIAVVKEEIESWYLAGISTENITKFKMKIFEETESISKEEFEKMIPRNFASKTEFMFEILKTYSIDKATELNASLKYFQRKFLDSKD